MIRSTPVCLRGKKEHVWLRQRYPVTVRHCGISPSFRSNYNHMRHMHGQRPLRLLGSSIKLPPIPYKSTDQIAIIENALALKRVEYQVTTALGQLSIGIRNAEEFVDDFLLAPENRPSLYALWFHDKIGLRQNLHVLSNLGAHHLVPIVSLLSYDVQRGKMNICEAEEVFVELMDASVAQPKIVQREIGNQMIRAFCLEEDVDKALQVVEEMKRKGIRRNHVTYSPIFRVLRKNEDVEGHMRLKQYVRDTEGGPLVKLLYIDIPRALYGFVVVARFNWIIISFLITMTVTVFVASKLSSKG